MSAESHRLENIVKEVEDSLGYIVFTGAITDKRDKDGNNVINWNYSRVRMSFEDALTAVEQLKKAVRDDLESFLVDQGEAINGA